jgi:hypothetical protein
MRTAARPKGPFYVLREDYLQGKTVDDAYAAGDRCFLYVPKPGDELNLLLLNIALVLLMTTPKAKR